MNPDDDIMARIEWYLAQLPLEEQPLFLIRIKRQLETRWTKAMDALDERNAEKSG